MTLQQHDDMDDSTKTVKFRWLNGFDTSDEEWNKIDGILEVRGWMSMARNTTRLRIAEDTEGNLLGFYCLQMAPHAEPLFVVPSMRGTGLAEKLADDMLDFLTEIRARGWFIIADNSVAAKMCEERGMKKLNSPVFVAGMEV